MKPCILRQGKTHTECGWKGTLPRKVSTRPRKDSCAACKVFSRSLQTPGKTTAEPEAFLADFDVTSALEVR